MLASWVTSPIALVLLGLRGRVTQHLLRVLLVALAAAALHHGLLAAGVRARLPYHCLDLCCGSYFIDFIYYII